MSSFEALARSALQRVAEIMADKASLESGKTDVGTKELHAKWDARFKKSSSKLSVPISFNFVDQAVRLSNGLLSKPVVRKALLDFESKWGKASPVNVMETLTALQSKVKGDADIALWIIASIDDLLSCSIKSFRDLSPIFLMGNRGSKGAFDMYIAKRGMALLLLNTHLSANNFPAQDLKTLSDICLDHATFRKRCGGGSLNVDIGWQGLLPEHSRKASHCNAHGPQSLDNHLRALTHIVVVPRSRGPAQVPTHPSFSSLRACRCCHCVFVGPAPRLITLRRLAL